MAELTSAARALALARRKKAGTCPICGQPFEGVGRRQYCSPKCYKRAYYQRHHDAVLARQRERRQRLKGQARGNQRSPSQEGRSPGDGS